MDNITRLFPIRTVAERTGLSTHAIRAWEKRYSAVSPHRTDTNRRLYSQRDVDRLVMLRQLTELGHTISSIAGLETEELRAQLNAAREVSVQAVTESESFSELGGLLLQARTAIEQYDREGLEDVLAKAHFELPLPRLMDEFVGPLLQWIGDGWHSGALRVAQEHLATAGIRNFLGNLQLLSKTNSDSRSMVVCTPSDQEHEMGALMAALIGESQGWRVIYLGARVPVHEAAATTIKTNSTIVAVSIAASENASSVFQELNTLCSMLSKDVTVVVGGAVAASHRKKFESCGAIVVDNFNEFTRVIDDASGYANAGI